MFLVLCCGGVAGTCRAEVICRQPSHDVGVVWTGDPIEHAFTLENTRPEGVWVNVIRACACSHTSRSFYVRPFESRDILIERNSQKIRAGRFRTSSTARIRWGARPRNPICKHCGYVAHGADWRNPCRADRRWHARVVRAVRSAWLNASGSYAYWPFVALLVSRPMWLFLKVRRPGTCGGCGYDMRGNVECVCSECGRVADSRVA